jgi:RimJ/RimL family protein N-acetyltransferase
MSPLERIETERLILRKPRMEDAPIIFEAYAQDLEVTRYLVWRPHKHVGETEGFLNYCLRVWVQETSFPYILTLRRIDEPVGMLEIHNKGFKLEVGYVLARSYWGKGYMTEALRAVIAWAIGRPDIFRLQAVCDVDNLGSARVMEKAGMEREGLLRRYVIHPNISPQPRDAYTYAIVK